MPCGFDVNKPCFRFTVLVFTSLLSFGSQFCYDMLTVLQKELQGDFECNANETTAINSSVSCCLDCLGLSGPEYNSLFTVYSWTSAISVFIAGLLLDKFGNRIGAFSFTLLCVAGTAALAWGAMLRNTQAMLPMMLFGRMLYAIGYGSLTVTQNRLLCFWFANKELSLAFGLNLSLTRMGSVVNFFVTAHLYNAVGLITTLWIGVVPCFVSFLLAFILVYLDTSGTKELGLSEKLESDSKKFKITDIKQFSSMFWLLSLTMMFLYTSVMPFIADASKFIQDKFGYNSVSSAYIAGTTYYMLVVLSPFMGGLVDFAGKRGYLSVVSSVLVIFAFVLLAFTSVHPLVSTLSLGLMFAIGAVTLWPCIAMVVPAATVGTANGLILSMQMIDIGLSNLIVGFILGKNHKLPIAETLLRWKYVTIYLLGNALACLVSSVLLNIQDKKMNCGLNLSKKQAKEKAEGLNVNTTNTSSTSITYTNSVTA